MSGNKNIERIGITAIILAVISAFLLSGFTTEKETLMEKEKLTGEQFEILFSEGRYVEEEAIEDIAEEVYTIVKNKI